MKIRSMLVLAATAVAVLVFTTACDPQEGQDCSNPGEYWTHVEGQKRTSLTCSPAGINPDGSQQYKWVKA